MPQTDQLPEEENRKLAPKNMLCKNRCFIADTLKWKRWCIRKWQKQKLLLLSGRHVDRQTEAARDKLWIQCLMTFAHLLTFSVIGVQNPIDCTRLSEACDQFFFWIERYNSLQNNLCKTVFTMNNINLTYATDGMAPKQFTLKLNNNSTVYEKI